MISWLRNLLAEDQDEPLPREWVMIAIFGSVAALWLGSVRDETSRNLLLRFAADDFVLNVLAGVALVGPGLFLTNVVARRLASRRRMARAVDELSAVLASLAGLTAAVQAARQVLADRCGRFDTAVVPQLLHPSFEANAANLRRFLIESKRALTGMSPPVVGPTGLALTPAEEQNLVRVECWPDAVTADQIGMEVKGLATVLQHPSTDGKVVSALAETLAQPRTYWTPSRGEGAQLIRERGQLTTGHLVAMKDYAHAAADLATCATSLIEIVGDMLPGRARSVAAARHTSKRTRGRR